MEAKGTLLISLQEFVLAYYGGEGFVKWVTALEPEIHEAYRSKIPSSDWFPLEPFLAQPLRTMCDIFFEGDPRGAWECGRYSADLASNRFLRLFVRIASTHVLLKRASDILQMYYRPCTLRLVDSGDKEACLHVVKFEQISHDLEHRIGGWMERALEISTGHGVKVEITSSLANGDKVTEFRCNWE